MPKYSFDITTREGHRISTIQIFGFSMPEAETKLRKMYHQCDIAEARELEESIKFSSSSNFEDILNLITR